MLIFIENYYNRKNNPEELGILLSDIQLLGSLLRDIEGEGEKNGLSTADPASWSDWLESVKTVLREEKKHKTG